MATELRGSLIGGNQSLPDEQCRLLVHHWAIPHILPQYLLGLGGFKFPIAKILGYLVNPFYEEDLKIKIYFFLAKTNRLKTS